MKKTNYVPPVVEVNKVMLETAIVAPSSPINPTQIRVKDWEEGTSPASQDLWVPW